MDERGSTNRQWIKRRCHSAAGNSGIFVAPTRKRGLFSARCVWRSRLAGRAILPGGAWWSYRMHALNPSALIMGPGQGFAQRIRKAVSKICVQQPKAKTGHACPRAQCPRRAMGYGRGCQSRFGRGGRNHGNTKSVGFYRHPAVGTVFPSHRRALHFGAHGPAAGYGRFIGRALALAHGHRKKRQQPLQPHGPRPAKVAGGSVARQNLCAGPMGGGRCKGRFSW